MKQTMFTPEEIMSAIHQGQKLFLAADEKVLAQLPRGEWIGGTIPYFMTAKGGQFSRDRIYGIVLPDDVRFSAIMRYSAETIERVYTDIPEHGVGLILMPAACRTLFTFALQAHNFKNFALRPLVGWVTGVALDDLGQSAPKIFDGRDGTCLEDAALVMHFALPAHQVAEINILNIFEQGDGDTLTFPEDGFSATEVFINGERRVLTEYLEEERLDIRLPFVADYNGAMINTGIQQVDAEKKRVDFYAPIFQDIEYRQARPIEDYVTQFLSQLRQEETESIFFSCNCILNYLYSELEGKKTGEITGPMTFGEIAYQLLNQTLVYLTISEVTETARKE